MSIRASFVRALLTTLIALVVRTPTQGALDLTSTSYSQNFNFLSSTTPVTWVNDQATETTSGSPGWYWDGGKPPYGVDDGSLLDDLPLSYGPSSNSDRAMGNLSSIANGDAVWGITFHNVLSDAIISLEVKFTGEKWRNSDAVADTLTFSYKTSSTNINNFETSSGTVPTGWTPVPALNFTATDTGTTGAVDGNDAANRTMLSSTISVTVPLGHYIALRWFDDDVSLNDHGIAIDDLFVTATVPEPGAALFGGLACGVAVLTILMRRALAHAIVSRARRL
jgi:hypothetical protein